MASLPPETKWSEKTWIHTTKSYPIKQFPSMITSRKNLIDEILILWRTSYICATEIVSVAHRTWCVTKIAYFCGAPQANAPQK
jgi:hypothetical protein